MKLNQGQQHAKPNVSSAGLMPTEARGNYLPEAPYLRETKTYLNCNRACSAWVHRTCLITIYQYDYHIIQ